MTDEHFGFLAAAVGGSLVLSAVLKLRRRAPFESFLDSVVSKPGSTRALAVGVPVLELLIGLMLLTPLARIAAFGAAMLSVAFVAFAIKAIQMPNAPGCGCFGSLDATTQHWVTLGRAILVAVAAFLCVVLTVRGGEVGPQVFVLVVGALTGIGLALSLTLLGHIVDFGVTLRRLLLRADANGRPRSANVGV